MNYKEFIQNIINTRGQWNIPKEEYYEPHHITPKCSGGLPLHYQKNKRECHPNIIWLTPKEHFEAHRLLYLENKDNKKLVWVFMVMCNKHPDFYTSDDYEQAKLTLSKIMTGKKWDLKSRQKLSNSLKGRFVGEKNGMYGKKGILNPLYGRKLPKYRLKQISKIHKGKKLTEEQKQKIRDNAKNNPNFGNRGKHLKESHKKILREKNSKKVICLETNKIYNSLEEACKDIGCSKALICLVCKNKRKDAKGFHLDIIRRLNNEN